MSDPAVLPEALKRAHAVMDRIEAHEGAGHCGDPWLLRWAAGWSWRWPATTGSPSMTRRRASGFPEVNLGIFPGFGGTGRSIRQAGPVPAMQAMLTGRMIKAGAARGMGLVDKLVRHRDSLHWEARKAVLGKKRSRRRRRSRSGSWRGGRSGRRSSRRCARRHRKKARKEHYPAPHALIDLFEKHGDNWRAMVDGEAAGFVPLMASDTARNLRRVFFLSESLKKQGLRGQGEAGVQARACDRGGRDGRRYRGLVRATRSGGDAAGPRHGAHPAGARPGEVAVQEAAQGTHGSGVGDGAARGGCRGRRVWRGPM